MFSSATGKDTLHPNFFKKEIYLRSRSPGEWLPLLWWWRATSNCTGKRLYTGLLRCWVFSRRWVSAQGSISFPARGLVSLVDQGHSWLWFQSQSVFLSLALIFKLLFFIFQAKAYISFTGSGFQSKVCFFGSHVRVKMCFLGSGFIVKSVVFFFFNWLGFHIQGVFLSLSLD